VASPASPHPTWRSVRAYFKKLYMWSCFAKRFTKTALTPSIELFMELKHKKMTSLVKRSRAKRSLTLKIEISRLVGVFG
jgi:hypothetical protein